MQNAVGILGNERMHVLAEKKPSEDNDLRPETGYCSAAQCIESMTDQGWQLNLIFLLQDSSETYIVHLLVLGEAMSI